MAKNLKPKLAGIKMIAMGLVGRLINELEGLRLGEPLTTVERNKLPNGYVIKGFGHFIDNKDYIFKGRNLIQEGRSGLSKYSPKIN